MMLEGGWGHTTKLPTVQAERYRRNQVQSQASAGMGRGDDAGAAASPESGLARAKHRKDGTKPEAEHPAGVSQLEKSS